MRGLAVLTVTLALTASPACAETEHVLPDDGPLEPIPEAPQPIMAGIADSMSRLLPLTLQDGAFGDPAHRATIDAALAGLETHAASLERYAWGEDAGFSWLARSLADDVRTTKDAHGAGRAGAASFYAQRLTAHCVACHSRRPDAKGSALGAALMGAVDPAETPLDELAFLQQATRQWEAAAGTYETLLAEPPSRLGGGPTWWFTDYLVLCIRVLEQPHRTLPLLQRHATNEELPELVRSDLVAWADAVKALGPLPDARDAWLVEARGLVEGARAASKRGTGRAALVQWIRASALLLRYVDGRTEGEELAEAYWLLGLSEAEIGHAPQLSMPEYYLEAAVRAAPGSPAAAEALAMLEWRVAVQYTGSGGEHVPADVRQDLDRLRALVREAAP